MEGDFWWPSLRGHGNTWVLRNISSGKVKRIFFFNKSCSDKNGKPSSGKFSFYFRFPVVAIH